MIFARLAELSNHAQQEDKIKHVGHVACLNRIEGYLSYLSKARKVCIYLLIEQIEHSESNLIFLTPLSESDPHFFRQCRDYQPFFLPRVWWGWLSWFQTIFRISPKSFYDHSLVYHLTWLHTLFLKVLNFFLGFRPNARFSAVHRLHCQIWLRP